MVPSTAEHISKAACTVRTPEFRMLSLKSVSMAYLGADPAQLFVSCCSLDRCGSGIERAGVDQTLLPCHSVLLAALLGERLPGSDALSGTAACQRLLASLAPANFTAARLLCRVLVDDKVLADTLKRTGRPDSSTTAACAAAADSQKGVAAITDADKRFVSQASSEVNVAHRQCPHDASTQTRC